MADSRKLSGRKTQEQGKVLLKIAKEKIAIRDLELEIERLDKLNNEKNEVIHQLEKKLASNFVNLTDKEIINKILSYFAKGCTYKTIYDKMLFNNYEGSIEYISEICKNVEDLDNEHLLYYKEQVVIYEESLKINPDIMKDTLVQVLNQLINDASMDLEKVDDIAEKRKLREEINKHAKELSVLLKTIVDDKDSVDDKRDIANKVMEGYNSENSIVSFKAIRREIK